MLDVMRLCFYFVVNKKNTEIILLFLLKKIKAVGTVDVDWHENHPKTLFPSFIHLIKGIKNKRLWNDDCINLFNNSFITLYYLCMRTI